MKLAEEFTRRRTLSGEECRSAAVRWLGSFLPEPRRRVAELTAARRAMACEFSITFPAGCGGAIDAGHAALDEVERLESKLSVYLDESALSALNRTAAQAPVRLDEELYGFLRAAARLSEATGGAFDVASGALVRAWGFFRGPKRVPEEAERVKALAATGSAHLLFDDRARTVRFLRPGLELNPGSIGKGFAIDRALQRVRARYGIGCALMQGGQSSLKGMGAPPGEPRGWWVAIEDPLRPGRHLARVRLRDRALGTSGAANQFFVHEGRRYGHVLDPRTGWPARGLLSVSALAPTAAEADALSTAFFVLGTAGTRRFCARNPGFGAILVSPPGEPSRAVPRVEVVGAADVEVMV
jgi:thiamine biosynthesis lipoprotein